MYSRFPLLLVAIAAAPAWAQSAPAQPSQNGQPNSPDARARQDRLVRATRLPVKADEVRRKGVPAGEMKEALDAAKAKGVHADEMSDVAESASKDMDQHGRIDNF